MTQLYSAILKDQCLSEASERLSSATCGNICRDHCQISQGESLNEVSSSVPLLRSQGSCGRKSVRGRGKTWHQENKASVNYTRLTRRQTEAASTLIAYTSSSRSSLVCYSFEAYYVDWCAECMRRSRSPIIVPALDALFLLLDCLVQPWHDGFTLNLQSFIFSCLVVIS